MIAEAETEAFRAIVSMLWKHSIMSAGPDFQNHTRTHQVYFPAKTVSVSDCVFVGRASKTDGKVAVGVSIPQFLGGSQTINAAVLPRTYNVCPCNLNQVSQEILLHVLVIWQWCVSISKHTHTVHAVDTKRIVCLRT